MRLERFDTNTLDIRVGCTGAYGWEVLGRLSSLVMVAYDCAVPSITCEGPMNLPPPIRDAVDQFIMRNPVIRFSEAADADDSDDGLDYTVVGRSAEFLCLRDAYNEASYSIYMAALNRNVDLASRCAYLIANVLGFTSLLSFEVRFSVYELLSNIVEHGKCRKHCGWIQLALEKKADRLFVSIVDKDISFDPTANDNFDLDDYLSSGRRKGLGLILTRRIAERMRYKRELGFNKIFFEKSVSSLIAAKRLNKEGEMAQLEVGDPENLQDGDYIVKLKGDLDTKGALIMEDLMSRLIDRKIIRVVLDFKEVPFVSSAGVGILLGMVSTLRDEGGDVTFVNISQKVRSVFRLLNLDDFFSIADTSSSFVES